MPPGEALVVPGRQVVPTRKVDIHTNIRSPRERILRQLFEHLSYVAPTLSLQRLANCVADAESGLIVRADGAFDELTQPVASYHVDTTREGLAERIRTSASERMKGEMIHVFPRSSGAYGTFLLDGLCGLAELKDYIAEHRLKLWLPAVFPKWVSHYLSQLGFGWRRAVRVGGVVGFNGLTLSTTLNCEHCFHPNPESLAKLRRFVGAPEPTPTRRLYLTRDSGSSPRFVENEAEVRRLFAQAGFESVDPGRLGFRDQIELFASAKTIAGSHGSAFANMIFAAPGARIIDLMPEDWIGYWDDDGRAERWLFNLTGACGHDYSLVLSPSRMNGDRFRTNSGTRPPTLNSIVDVAALRDALACL